MEIVKPKLDVVFKKLFTSDNDVLKAFVGDILDMEEDRIQRIEVVNSKILPLYVDGKKPELDLNMLVDNEIVNVEIQLQNKGDFKERSLYYWAKLFSDQLKSGEEYMELKRTITVNILNFNLFEEKDEKKKNPYSHFTLRDNVRNEELTDKCSINFIELQKVDEEIDKNNRKKLWLQLIKAETEEELTMLNKTEVPEIKKAVVILHEMNADEEMREIARLREKMLHDEASMIGSAKREGRAEERQKMIEKMRRSGMSEEQIKLVLNS